MSVPRFSSSPTRRTSCAASLQLASMPWARAERLQRRHWAALPWSFECGRWPSKVATVDGCSPSARMPWWKLGVLRKRRQFRPSARLMRSLQRPPRPSRTLQEVPQRAAPTEPLGTALAVEQVPRRTLLHATSCSASPRRTTHCAQSTKFPLTSSCSSARWLTLRAKQSGSPTSALATRSSANGCTGPYASPLGATLAGLFSTSSSGDC
mmetsp:Transcript_61553/g.133220  ORF Transcript_61553/g.133220 Transcript_61553/m.133220 type:complete len:209 (+) Transcript_61553:768-1394(+)